MMVLHSCGVGSVGIGCKETIIENVAVLLLHLLFKKEKQFSFPKGKGEVARPRTCWELSVGTN